jgi:hypothetical protein
MESSKAYREFVDNLSYIEKFNTYMDYYLTILGLKLDFYLVQKIVPSHIPASVIKEYTGEWRYLWRDTRLPEFEDFIKGGKGNDIYYWYWRINSGVCTQVKS